MEMELENSALSFYFYRAKVLRIVDGDTVDLQIDLGFSVFIKQRCRLFGINAPEKRGATKEAGLAAQAFLESLVPVGAKLTIETIKDQQGKYGRYLVRLHKDNWCINNAMVLHGHAKWKDY